MPPVEKSMTQQQVDDKARVTAMLPGERQAYENNPAGHRQFHEVIDLAGNVFELPRQSDKYQWANSGKSNKNGKLTKVGAGIIDMFQGFVRADNERFGALQENVERVAMKDAEGRPQFVEPGQADDCARRNGWGHSWRARGLITRTGPDGMDFRWIDSRGWEATGYVLRRGERVPIEPIGAQRDPDGNPWEFTDGEWRRACR